MNFCRIVNACLEPMNWMDKAEGGEGDVKVVKAGPIHVTFVLAMTPILYLVAVPVWAVIHVSGTVVVRVVPEKICNSLTGWGERIDRWIKKVVNSALERLRVAYYRKFVHFCPDFVSEDRIELRKEAMKGGDIQASIERPWILDEKLGKFFKGIEYDAKYNVFIDIKVVD